MPLLSLYDQKKEALHGNGGPYDCLPCKVLKMFVVIFHIMKLTGYSYTACLLKMIGIGEYK
jgi:hypothetical protein